MSVVTQVENGYVLCHKTFLEENYKNVRNGNTFCRIRPLDHMFLVNTPYKKDAEAEKEVMSFGPDSPKVGTRARKRKRKTTHSNYRAVTSEMVNSIRTVSSEIIEDAKRHGCFRFATSPSDVMGNNHEARSLSVRFHQEASKWKLGNFIGGNYTDESVLMPFGSQRFVFPKQCKFFCHDVNEMDNHLDALGKFDLIVLDPPWWNKYIRRKKSKCLEEGYQMMYNEDLMKLPLKHLLAPNGIIAVWCTNSDSHLEILRNQLLPAWGARYVSQWTWLKVTKAGEPICSFSDPPGKQPFEQLLFGVCVSGSDRAYPIPQNGKQLISIPSAIHSHKPPLADVLQEYLPEKPHCLEVFARYLLPYWTSWGLEVIKLQHLSLFSAHDIQG